MTNKELSSLLVGDLRELELPIDEVDVYVRPFSKTFYGRYFPSGDSQSARIFLYPYADKNGSFLDYGEILVTLIHELVHHIQYSDDSFKRLKGVMHNIEFWSIFNKYVDKAERCGMIKKVKKC